MTGTLVLLACSAKKNPSARLVDDLYTGALWEVFRKYRGEGDDERRDVMVISAKHGCLFEGEACEPYEQELTDERIGELAELPDNLEFFFPDDIGYERVIVAGGKRYRKLADRWIEQLRECRVIEPYAPIESVEGGIGEQRGRLGELLRAN